jgi:hypothetical protein
MAGPPSAHPWIEPGVYPKIPDGRKDDPHFVEAGAKAVAAVAVADLRAQNPLVRWLKSVWFGSRLLDPRLHESVQALRQVKHFA